MGSCFSYFYEFQNHIRTSLPDGLEGKFQFCESTGAINIVVEICAYLHIIWLSILIKEMVQKPLKSHKRIQVLAHTTSLLAVIVSAIVTWQTLGFGVSLTLTCGIALSQDTIYDLLIRMWPILFIPLVAYNYYYLVRKTPKLIQNEVKLLD